MYISTMISIATIAWIRGEPVLTIVAYKVQTTTVALSVESRIRGIRAIYHGKHMTIVVDRVDFEVDGHSLRIEMTHRELRHVRCVSEDRMVLWDTVGNVDLTRGAKSRKLGPRCTNKGEENRETHGGKRERERGLLTHVRQKKSEYAMIGDATAVLICTISMFFVHMFALLLLFDDSCTQCTIPILQRVPDEPQTRPFVVRLDPSRDHPWFSGDSLPSILSTYGNHTDHYSGRSIRDKWEQGGLVGIHLEGAARMEWEHVLNVTGDVPAGWKRHDVSLGLIVGHKGDGVVNDAHMSVYFLHLLGRKAWSLGREPHMGWNSSTLQGMCSEDLFDHQEYVCILTVGDLLYVPEGWFHTTCHLDEPSLALIQWEGA